MSHLCLAATVKYCSTVTIPDNIYVSSEEIKMAIDAGFAPVSLGDSRLRTETAGVVACHTFNLLNE